MDIEEVAEKTPEKLIKVYVDPLIGIQPYHLRKVAFGLNISPDCIKEFFGLLKRYFRSVAAATCSAAPARQYGR
jgi:succinyl-CoA synthetase beta subunit